MASFAEWIGQEIEGRYRLVSILGQGSYGCVFQAAALHDGEETGNVAVKVLQPQNEQEKQQVLREISAGNQLSHDCINLITLLSSGIVKQPEHLAGFHFLVTELGETTLESRLLQAEPPSPEECAQIAVDLARALRAMHLANAVHRDIKPGNLILVNGRWKLADFGLTMAADNELDQQAPNGTPAYMSPESFRRQLGLPQDIWAFGAVLQECLTGKLPYSGQSVEALSAQAAADEPHIEEGLPEPFNAIVRGCLRRDPRERLTIEDILEKLQPKAVEATLPPPAPVAPPPPSAQPVKIQRPRPQVKKRLWPAVPNQQPTDGLPDTWDSSGTHQPADHSVLADIPAGTFLYGPDAVEYTLPAFQVSKYPVTNAQFQLFLDARPQLQAQCKNWQVFARRWGARAPAVGVSWHMAQEYCAWAGLRLLSQEEWERAARHIDGRMYPWGPTWNPSLAVVASQGPQPVGLFPQGASPEGVMDLIGNCWEWTSSASSNEECFICGGSWASSVGTQLQATFRETMPKARQHSRLGFRCGK